MNKRNSTGMLFAAVLLALTTLFMPTLAADVAAQDTAPVVDTETPEPPTPTPTNTVEPTAPATATNTVAPDATATLTPEPGPEPSPTTEAPAPPQVIPEPITVVLFGTGLAALSAAVARRKQQE